MPDKKGFMNETSESVDAKFTCVPVNIYLTVHTKQGMFMLQLVPFPQDAQTSTSGLYRASPNTTYMATCSLQAGEVPHACIRTVQDLLYICLGTYTALVGSQAW